MKRVAWLFVGGLLAAAPIWMGAAPSGAATASRTPKFVGTYAVYEGGTGVQTDTWTVNLDGTATNQDARVMHWANKGRRFRMTYRHAMFSERWTGMLTQHGLSSKKSPGTYPGGTWYAIRTG